MDKLDAIGFYSESLPLDIDNHQENGLTKPCSPSSVDHPPNDIGQTFLSVPSTRTDASLLPAQGKSSHTHVPATATVSPPQQWGSKLDQAVKQEDDDDNDDVVFLFTNKVPSHVSSH